ncbi:hypothetical protein [Echinicola sp. 20G]|uniref:hypothetical protein n=1 Tax=Echinicola sp. 20G TaxID=2781961 RepID=UPI0019105278|nr:hypothetical protein [Echinicola sp. 20G]
MNFTDTNSRKSKIEQIVLLSIWTRLGAILWMGVFICLAAIDLDPYLLLNAMVALGLCWAIEKYLLNREAKLRNYSARKMVSSAKSPVSLKTMLMDFLFSFDSLFYWTALSIHLLLFFFLVYNI